MRQLNDTSMIIAPQGTLVRPTGPSRRRDAAKTARRDSQPEAMLALCLTSLLGWAVTGLLVLLVG